jgi:serine phosphatase RsbU (regulator of sigma subunit)
MTVANAGHIPPYVNGAALEFPGSMPLGILPGSQFDVQTVHVAAHDHITFLTDGILEARNADGQLLGFDETARLSSHPPETIAAAAIRHGQDDDITVVGIRVTPQPQAFEAPMALESSPA